MTWTRESCARPGTPIRQGEWLLWPAAVVVTVALALLVTGCGSGQAETDNPGGVIHGPRSDAGGYHGVALTDPYQVPSVTLTDTEDQPFDLVADTTRPVTLVFFGYTNCPDICNLVMADVASAMSRLDPAIRRQVQMLFVTTDPARDDPQQIRSYLDRFDPSFEGVTGPIADIKKAAKPLGVPIEGKNKLPSGGYEVGHGTQVLGVGKDDAVHVVWTEGTSVGDLTDDITRLVRAQD